MDGSDAVLGSLEAVAGMYAQEALRLRQRVHATVDAPDPVVEDACQVAWSRLVRDRMRVRRGTAVAWLTQVAVRESYRLMGRIDNEVSLNALLDEREDGAEPSAPRLLDELTEQRARLDGLRILPERQQRMMWLHGAGLSYGEIAGRTGDSERTVERQLKRARFRLARAGI